VTEAPTLTVKQAARYLQLDPQTVSRKLQCGQLPGVKIGRQWRTHRADLDRFLAGEMRLPEPAELTPEAARRTWRAVEAAVSAAYPLEVEPLPPGYQEALDHLWQRLGFDGYDPANLWVDLGDHGKEQHKERLEAAVASLSDEDRDALVEGRRIAAENALRRQEHAAASWRLARDELAARGFVLAADPDELPAFVAAVATGQGLLRRTAKEKLETAGRRDSSL
jgi:excisionase family DNA binding protein